jgi:hypothetical protein
MRDLKTLREGWDEVAREERRYGGQLRIEQSVSIYLSLCRDLAPQMEETEEIFRRDREAYVAELQARLLRLNDFPTNNLETLRAVFEIGERILLRCLILGH